MGVNPAVIRLLLVDDHASYRAGIRALAELEPDLEVVGEAGTAEEAIAQLETLCGAVDVVVLDVDMPGAGGLHATQVIDERWPDIAVLLLSGHTRYSESGIQAGARAYILKDADEHEIFQAVRAVHRGTAVLDPRIQGQIVAAMQGRTPGLTVREADVLTALSNGASNSELMAQFALSESAIGRLIASIEAKLGAESRAHAVAIALRRGLIR